MSPIELWRAGAAVPSIGREGEPPSALADLSAMAATRASA
jgi:hypothetical protein